MVAGFDHEKCSLQLHNKREYPLSHKCANCLPLVGRLNCQLLKKEPISHEKKKKHLSVSKYEKSALVQRLGATI